MILNLSPYYISEVKIGMGKSAEDAKKALEGYEILDTDLNSNAGGGWGSKGEKAVYLGYKTTKNRSEAITDLALMNMKGGFVYFIMLMNAFAVRRSESLK